MYSPKEMYTELLAMTQLHLLQTDGIGGKIVASKETRGFFKDDRPAQKPRQPIPEPPVNVIAPQKPIMTTPTPMPKEEQPTLKNQTKTEPAAKATVPPKAIQEPQNHPTTQPPHDFKEMHSLVKKLFPSQVILEEMPDPATSTVLLVNDSKDPLIIEFVKKVADAIQQKLGHQTKIVSSFEKNSTAKLILVPESLLPDSVNPNNFMKIPSWHIFLQEPQRKNTLWNDLQKTLR